MFVILFTQGVPKDSIYNLTYEEAQLLMNGYQSGVFGTLQETKRDYITYCQLHNLLELTVAVNSKNKKKPKKPIQFTEYAKEFSSFLGFKPETVGSSFMDIVIKNMENENATTGNKD